MRWKKIPASLFLILLCGALLHGQSLYELAQKEKARRAKLKGKTSRVITNADLRTSQGTAGDSTRSTQPAAKTGQQPVQENVTAPSSRLQRNPPSATVKYASEVLSGTRLVNNPELALKKPDGRYAEIKYSGILDLSVTVDNESGADIAIYARPSGLDTVRQGGQEEGGISTAATLGMVEGFWYGVFALDKNGEWIALGKGTGENRPESFELGEIASTSKIRIIFNISPHADLPYNRIRNTPQEITFGIDAVSALH